MSNAQDKLYNLNPGIRTSCVSDTITDDMIPLPAGGADLIIDAVDPMDTRHTLNRYSMRTGKPFIHGAVNGLSGQMMVILPGKTACPRRPAGSLPKPGTIPVPGTTAGMIGIMQANEAVRLITGGEPSRPEGWSSGMGTRERLTGIR